MLNFMTICLLYCLNVISPVPQLSSTMVAIRTICIMVRRDKVQKVWMQSDCIGMICTIKEQSQCAFSNQSILNQLALLLNRPPMNFQICSCFLGWMLLLWSLFRLRFSYSITSPLITLLHFSWVWYGFRMRRMYGHVCRWVYGMCGCSWPLPGRYHRISKRRVWRQWQHLYL